MKTYTYTITFDNGESSSSDYISSILDELNDESKQFDLSLAINKKTCDTLAEMLFNDIKNQLNNALEGSGIEFDLEGTCATVNIPKYNVNTFVLGVELFTPRKTFISVMVKPIINKDFKDSKYPTYTGDYEMFVTTSDASFNGWFTDRKVRVESVSLILDCIRPYIKDHLHYK